MAQTQPLTIRQALAIDGVASEASLGRASERLGTSQSSLSRHVSEAERALGHQLFQRGWSGMEPTSAGAIVIAQCHRMIGSIAWAQRALEASGSRRGSLSHYLTWDLLAAVQAVRSTGSVSMAAAYLGVSQPNVSRALAKVAAAIGRPVFRRARAGVTPTREADILCDLRQSLLADVAGLADELNGLAVEVTGRVAVGLLPFSEQDAVIEVFGEMMRRHKHVRLQAVTGSYSALIDGLLKGELDFVIGILRTPAPFDALEELHLFDETFAVVVRKGHPVAEARPALQRLLQENWMVAPHGTPTRLYFEDWLAREGFTPPRQTCEIVTFHLAEQMILNSDAVGLLTYSQRKRRAVRSAGLKILPLRLPESVCPVGLTYRKRQRLSDAQRSFVDHLSETWRRHPT